LSITNTGNDTITCGYATYLQRTISPSGASMTWWADNDTIPNPNTTTNFNATPKFNTLYVATAFYNGCTVSDSLIVYVNPLPAEAGLDTVLCNGNSLTLIGNTVFGASYSWSPSNLVDTNFTAITDFIGTQNTNLIYTVTRAGCSSSDTIHIEVQGTATADFSPNFNLSSLTVDFINSSNNFDSLLWDFGDGFMDTILNPTHTYMQNGFYTACLYVINECGIDSICQPIDLTIVGMQETSAKPLIMRSENGFIISQQIIMTSCFLYDLNGKQLHQKVMNNKQTSLDFTELPKGCYILEVVDENQKNRYKLIW
jgi:PKD repeat protein